MKDAEIVGGDFFTQLPAEDGRAAVIFGDVSGKSTSAALYGALAELEEVVVLYTEHADLRLWIVDHEGDEWVSMPRSNIE